VTTGTLCRVELLHRTARALNRSLRRGGYEVRKVPKGDAPAHEVPQDDAGAYLANVRAIRARHRAQTQADVERLTRKYSEPVFGEMRAWDLVEMLARCIDPSDLRLGLASQEVHVLQMLDAMTHDGVSSPDLVLAALLHDVGKVLLLTGEDPANVVCAISPIGEFAEGCGLDHCVLQWNHDEFGYTRFKDHVPEHVAWLVRYHGIDMDSCAPLMDERDRAYHEQYLTTFRHYDQGTKSPYTIPASSLADYRDVIEDAFPSPIIF
jgi:predicted HD phosphohydrolase